MQITLRKDTQKMRSSPVCLEHLKAINIEQTENSDIIRVWLSDICSWQRRVDVFHNPHEQAIIDAFSERVSGVRSLLTSEWTRHLQTIILSSKQVRILIDGGGA